MLENIYYVYALIDPRTNKPFYIGEGKGKRAWSHLTFNSGCNNPHKDRIILKIKSLGLEVQVKILQNNLTKQESIHLEEQTINEIGLENLSNICKNANPPIYSGQDNGFYGKKHSEETKRKCGDSNRGKDLKSIEGKQSIANAIKKRWTDPEWEKYRQQVRERTRSLHKTRKKLSKEEASRVAINRNANMTPESRSARTLAGCETKKIKYAGLRRKSYLDENGQKRFKWIPEVDYITQKMQDSSS